MRRFVVLVVIVLAARAACGEGEGAAGDTLRLGTFNIRFFPEEATDRDRVAQRIAELDADAFAVQEIVDPDALALALAIASRRTGRDYAVHLGRYCTDYVWYLGVVYDRSRLSLVEVRALPPAQCRADHPSMHVALLEGRGTRVALAAVHLKAGGDVGEHARRKRQWTRLLATQRRLEDELGARMVLAGDFNTTGFTDDAAGERSYIERMTDAAGLRVLTRDVRCSAYWRPPGDRGYQPSLLDHLVARGDDFSPPQVFGYCRELSCRPAADEPGDHARVSDHCPVAVDLRLRP